MSSEGKKFASSARREIEKQQKNEDKELQEEIKKLQRKMYWEEFRHNSYTNIKDNILLGVGVNAGLALFLRSVVIFPIGFMTFSSFLVFRAWRKTAWINSNE